MTTARLSALLANACAALEAELRKVRRATVTRLVTVLLVAGVPACAVGAVIVARTPQLPGSAAIKFEPYAVGDLAVTLLVVLGQILSVAVLLAGGFAHAWAFGREFTDGTAGAMAGLPVGRGAIAVAKGLVLTGWLACCVAGAVGIGLAFSTVSAGGRVLGEALVNAGVALEVGMLTVLLGPVFGWVASLLRSPFGTVGVLIGMIVLTEFAVILGAGGWFPLAVPSLLAGMGGGDAQASVASLAVALTAMVGPAALVAVAAVWRSLDDT